jgi:hypothetical protein
MAERAAPLPMPSITQADYTCPFKTVCDLCVPKAFGHSLPANPSSPSAGAYGPEAAQFLAKQDSRLAQHKHNADNYSMFATNFAAKQYGFQFEDQSPDLSHLMSKVADALVAQVERIDAEVPEDGESPMGEPAFDCEEAQEAFDRWD